jgi:hypothetical protein
VAKKQYTVLEQELSAYGACDPAKMEEKKRGVFLAHEAAIRWTGEFRTHIYVCGVISPQISTDNYSMLLSHFTRQNGVDPGDVRKFLGVSEEYEDIC